MIRTVLFLISVFGVAQGHADWSRLPVKDFPVQNPPLTGSEENRRELEGMLQLQSQRDPKDCALSESQRIPNFHVLFAPAQLLSLETMQRWDKLMNKALRMADRMASYYKDQYDRPRPYQYEERIKPCVTPPRGARSYPSAHAAMGALGGCILAEYFPEQEQAWNKFGNFLGDLRVIVGVHHPSDVAAGKKLGLEICARLLMDSDFREQANLLRR